MSYPYIGDRQLDPDDDCECPYCGQQYESPHNLRYHIDRCAENDNIDYPDKDYGEDL